MNLLYKTLATGFGSGYSPLAPGTMGALVGCLLLWGARLLATSSFMIFHLSLAIIILITTIIGAYITQQLEKEWGEDPSKIVIDEIVGVWLAVLFIPITWKYLLIGFLLFRLFDIWKPLGIRRLEAIPDGWGVMLDDVAAGIYSNLVLQLGILLLDI